MRVSASNRGSSSSSSMIIGRTEPHDRPSDTEILALSAGLFDRPISTFTSIQPVAGSLAPDPHRGVDAPLSRPSGRGRELGVLAWGGVALLLFAGVAVIQLRPTRSRLPDPDAPAQSGALVAQERERARAHAGSMVAAAQPLSIAKVSALEMPPAPAVEPPVESALAPVTPDPPSTIPAKPYRVAAPEVVDDDVAEGDDSTAPPFDRTVASASIQRAADGLASCREPAYGSGGARVSLTFAPSGRITQALIEPGSIFLGTPVASCVLAALRTVNVPPFSGEKTTVHTTIRVE